MRYIITAKRTFPMVNYQTRNSPSHVEFYFLWETGNGNSQALHNFLNFLFITYSKNMT